MRRMSGSGLGQESPTVIILFELPGQVSSQVTTDNHEVVLLEA